MNPNNFYFPQAAYTPTAGFQPILQPAMITSTPQMLNAFGGATLISSSTTETPNCPTTSFLQSQSRQNVPSFQTFSIPSSSQTFQPPSSQHHHDFIIPQSSSQPFVQISLPPSIPNPNTVIINDQQYLEFVSTDPNQQPQYIPIQFFIEPQSFLAANSNIAATTGSQFSNSLLGAGLPQQTSSQISGDLTSARITMTSQSQPGVNSPKSPPVKKNRPTQRTLDSFLKPTQSVKNNDDDDDCIVDFAHVVKADENGVQYLGGAKNSNAIPLSPVQYLGTHKASTSAQLSQRQHSANRPRKRTARMSTGATSRTPLSSQITAITPSQPQVNVSAAPSLAVNTTITQQIDFDDHVDHFERSPYSLPRPKVSEKPPPRVETPPVLKPVETSAAIKQAKALEELEKRFRTSSLNDTALPTLDFEVISQIAKEIVPLVIEVCPNASIKGIGPSLHECGSFYNVAIDADTNQPKFKWFFFTLSILTQKPGEADPSEDQLKLWVEEILQKIIEVENISNAAITRQKKAYKIQLLHSVANAKLVLLFNSPHAIKRSQLIKIYRKADERMVPLAFLYGNLILNTPSLHQLTNSPLCYLLIYFLQQHNYVKVLHENEKLLNEMKFLETVDLSDDQKSQLLNPEKSKDTVASMAYSFAKFYSTLDYVNTVIDVAQKSRRIWTVDLFEAKHSPLSIRCCFTNKNIASSVNAECLRNFVQKMKDIVKAFEKGKETSIFATHLDAFRPVPKSKNS